MPRKRCVNVMSRKLSRRALAKADSSRAKMRRVRNDRERNESLTLRMLRSHYLRTWSSAQVIPHTQPVAKRLDCVKEAL
jgi:hypothetical protein